MKKIELKRIQSYIAGERVTPELDYEGSHQDCVEWLEDFQEDYPEIDFVIVEK